MKLVILDGHGLNPGDLSWNCLRQFGELQVYDRTATEDEAITRAADAEVVLLNKVPITARLLDACPSIRLICVLATGYNVVDCQAASARGVPVCNVPGYGTASVAQFTFGLLLELCHRIGHHDQAVHQGRWSACPDFCFWDTPQTELAGKTMGIIGCGSIGRAVATIAAAFGMEVITYSRTQYPELRGAIQYVSLDELLARSDVVSLHCPQTRENVGMMNAEAFVKMKTGAILLNTARGGLIDEAALADALASGKLAGAAVDVAVQEPIPADSPLLTAPNCILTPHMAWSAQASRQRILDATARNIESYLAGHPVHVVNGI